ncbi:uncharacterized protein [Amphiura filiformis]|uniref:uncharacterized protein n=1 Tax=Amphiura filiformis TaxID=82378 RepID=UPI003B220F5C
MAIIRMCCCCGIRSGSIACAVYSIVIALLGIASFSFSWAGIHNTENTLYEIQAELPGLFGNLDIDSYIVALTVDYVLADITLSFVFITSIFVIVGINQDNKQLLSPFIVAKSVGFVWYLYAIAVSLYSVISIGYEYGGVAIVAELIALFPFFITDIVCVLCVLSQYQEYRDGRGRISDANRVNERQTTVVIEQQQLPSGTGAFAYQHMQGDLPPAYSNPTVQVKTVPGAI